MRRRVRFLLLVLAAFSLVPSTARAHVRLRRSDPAAGATLTSSPLALQFWFSEGVELAVTKVTLSDASGKLFSLTAPTAVENEAGHVRMSLAAPLDGGDYKVLWRTVALDGHVASGSFSFRVVATKAAVDTALASTVAPTKRDSVAAAPHAETQAKPAEVADMRSASPAYVAARSVSYASLLLLIGAPAFCFLVLRRTREQDPDVVWDGIERGVARIGALSAFVFIIAAFVRLYLQTRLDSGNDAPGVADMLQILSRTNWGTFWHAQVIAAGAALIALLFVPLYRSVAWLLAAVAAATTVVAVALSSHAGATEAGRFFAVLDDATHMLAVGAWLGGLFWLIVVALPRVSVDNRSPRTTVLVSAFSTVALASAGIMVFTGVVSAKLRLGSWGALVNSTYGQMLILKVLLVMGVATVGYFNWKKVGPAIAIDGSVDTLRKAGRAELITAMLVVIATAVLVALPTPASP